MFYSESPSHTQVIISTSFHNMVQRHEKHIRIHKLNSYKVWFTRPPNWISNLSIKGYEFDQSIIITYSYHTQISRISI